MTDLPRIKLKELMASIPEGLSPIERVVLAHDGTMHTLLSLLSGNKPIHINVIAQEEVNGVILRDITFTIDGMPIMKATSHMHIDKNPPAFIDAIRRKKSGIGQIINYLNLNTHRDMEYMSAEQGTLSRAYIIRGDCEVKIVETLGRISIQAWGNAL